MKRLIAVLATLLAFPAFSQAPPATGFPSYGSFEALQFDTVNRQNLNVHFGIPISASPGRGFDLRHSIVYDSAFWRIKTVAGESWWTPPVDADEKPRWGWRTDLTVGEISFLHEGTPCGVGVGSAPWYHDFAFTDSAGTSHPFAVAFHTHAPPLSDCSDWGTEPRTGYATDGSGYLLDASDLNNPFVLTPGGYRIDNNQKMTDPNGNFIQRVQSETDPNVFEWKDSRGKVALIIDLAPEGYPNADEYKVLDATGGYQTTRVHYLSFQILTNFDCHGIAEYSDSDWLPVMIELPDGRSWAFTYEATPPSEFECFGGCVTGRLKSITLPTGGVIVYTYPHANMGVSCEDGAPLNLSRADSSGSWNFAREHTTGPWRTHVTSPNLPYDTYYSVHSFNSSGETRQQVHSGATLLRTVDTTWSAGTPSVQTVTLDDGTATPMKSKVTTNFDSYGNLLNRKEYAFGQFPNTLLRETVNTYLATGDYTARNIRNRLASQIVKTWPTNQIVSRTEIEYDHYDLKPLVEVIGAPQHDDINYGDEFETRGNPTRVKRYLNPLNPVTPTDPIDRTVQYDTLGNTRTAELDCCQERQFQFSSATGWAFPDSVTSGPVGGPQLTVASTYNPHTGQVATTTDENNKTTTFEYDLFKRPTKVIRSDGTEFTTTYDDVARTVTTTVPLTASTSRKSKTLFDPYGRPYRTELRDGADTLVALTETQLDAMGRPWKTANPRSSLGDPTYWTETRLDALGRPTVVIPPGGTPTSNSTRYTYLKNTVTVTDPAGHQKKTESDALGHTTKLLEPNPANQALTIATNYFWTPLGKLSTVTKGSPTQTRSYTWDPLGRMLTETTPEAGTVSNTVIDVYGNVREKIDARGVKTLFGFDGLNRLTGISWVLPPGSQIPATAPISYVYGTDANQNNKGRLITITDGLGSETLHYNPLGQVSSRQRTIDGQAFSFQYTYNLAGELTLVTYPSGRVVTYGNDSVGRLTTVSTGGTNLVSNVAWNPAGLPTGWSYGNGVTATFGWDPQRLLLSSIRYDRPPPGGTMFNLAYEYGNATGNDGRIKQVQDLMVPDRTVHFEYDELLRLKRAHTDGGTTYPAWELNWSYSFTGNRSLQTAVVGNPPTSSLSFDSATNRVTTTGWSHDASGNVTATPDGGFTIDAAGRTIGHTPPSAPAIGFSFDATGLRAKRTEGSNATVYIRDGGQVIGEWSGTSWTKEYVWLGNTLLATIEGGAIKYHHADHLSVRATTFASGMVGEEQGHYPFGEAWYVTSPQTTRIFATYEREANGALDYAMFRWMGPKAGRFLSPDPIHGSLGDGQSWNRFTYAGNDPVNRWDPLGLYYTQATGASEGPGGGGDEETPQCNDGDHYICGEDSTTIYVCTCRDGKWIVVPGDTVESTASVIGIPFLWKDLVWYTSIGGGSKVGLHGRLDFLQDPSLPRRINEYTFLYDATSCLAALAGAAGGALGGTLIGPEGTAAGAVAGYGLTNSALFLGLQVSNVVSLGSTALSFAQEAQKRGSALETIQLRGQFVGVLLSLGGFLATDACANAALAGATVVNDRWDD